MAPFVDDPIAFLGGRGPDFKIVNDQALRPMLEAAMIAALSGGSDGMAQDLVSMWLPFGFALAEIARPVHVFQGGLDRDNHADARILAEQIPNAALTIWPDLGHFAILRRFPEVVASVLPDGR